MGSQKKNILSRSENIDFFESYRFHRQCLLKKDLNYFHEPERSTRNLIAMLNLSFSESSFFEVTNYQNSKMNLELKILE
jgi:hypothetical protein